MDSENYLGAEGEVSVHAEQHLQGRKAHPSWAYFTTMEAPWKEKSACCMHCNKLVSYNRKNEMIQKHLRYCTVFLDAMRSMPEETRPTFVLDNWLNPNSVKPQAPNSLAFSHFHHLPEPAMVHYPNNVPYMPVVSTEPNYSIEMKVPSHSFTASHLGAAGLNKVMRVEGHDYAVSLTFNMPMQLSNGHGLLCATFAQVIQRICGDTFNGRFLIPMTSPFHQVSITNVCASNSPIISEQIQLLCNDGSFFSFPKSSVVCLPLRFISKEELARYIWCEVVKNIGVEQILATGVSSMKLGVADTPYYTSYFTHPIPILNHSDVVDHAEQLRRVLSSIIHGN